MESIDGYEVESRNMKKCWLIYQINCFLLNILSFVFDLFSLIKRIIESVFIFSRNVFHEFLHIINYLIELSNLSIIEYITLPRTVISKCDIDESVTWNITSEGSN